MLCNFNNLWWTSDWEGILHRVGSGPKCLCCSWNQTFKNLKSLCGSPSQNKSDAGVFINATFKLHGDLLVSTLIYGTNHLFIAWWWLDWSSKKSTPRSLSLVQENVRSPKLGSVSSSYKLSGGFVLRGCEKG